MISSAGPFFNASLRYASFTASENSALVCTYSSNCSQNDLHCRIFPSKVGTSILGSLIPLTRGGACTTTGVGAGGKGFVRFKNSLYLQANIEDTLVQRNFPA